MKYPDTNPERLIASRVISLWAEHEEALEQAPLTYLDELMEVIVTLRPIDPDSLITKLKRILPDLPRGTVRQLVNLKFGNPYPTEILSRAA